MLITFRNWFGLSNNARSKYLNPFFHGKSQFNYRADRRLSNTAFETTNLIINHQHGDLPGIPQLFKNNVAFTDLVCDLETELANKLGLEKNCNSLIKKFKGIFEKFSDKDLVECFAEYLELSKLQNLKLALTATLFFAHNERLDLCNAVIQNLTAGWPSIPKNSNSALKYILWQKVFAVFRVIEDSEGMRQCISYMTKDRLEPGIKKYNLLLECYIKQSLYKRANKLYANIIEYGIADLETFKMLLIGENAKKFAESPHFSKKILSDLIRNESITPFEKNVVLLAHEILGKNLAAKDLLKIFERIERDEKLLLNVIEEIKRNLFYWNAFELSRIMIPIIYKNLDMSDTKVKMTILHLMLYQRNEQRILSILRNDHSLRINIELMIFDLLRISIHRGVLIEPILTFCKEEGIEISFQYIEALIKTFNNLNQVGSENLKAIFFFMAMSKQARKDPLIWSKYLFRIVKACSHKRVIGIVYREQNKPGNELPQGLYKYLTRFFSSSKSSSENIFLYFKSLEKSDLIQDCECFSNVFNYLERNRGQASLEFLSTVKNWLKIDQLSDEQYVLLYRSFVVHGMPGRVLESLEDMLQLIPKPSSMMVDLILEACILAPYSQKKTCWFWRQLEAVEYEISKQHLRKFLVVLCQSGLSHTAGHFVRNSGVLYRLQVSQSDLLAIKGYISPKEFDDIKTHFLKLPSNEGPVRRKLLRERNSEAFFRIKLNWLANIKEKNPSVLYKMYKEYLSKRQCHKKTVTLRSDL